MTGVVESARASDFFLRIAGGGKKMFGMDYMIHGKMYRYVTMGPLLFAKDLTGTDANTPVKDVSVPVLAADAADRISVKRTPLMSGWNWNAATAPIRLVLPDACGNNVELVPYGCAKMRISLF